MLGAGLGALVLDNALQAFRILLQIGAGTGLLFMLRWFWWRINAASELVAMVVSFALAVYFEIFGGTLFGWATLGWHKLVAAVVVTTSAWIATALLTTSTDEETLERFYRQILPGGPGWNVVRRRAEANGPPLPAVRSNLTSGILCMLLGSLAVYSALFATGLVLYGRYSWAGLFVGLGGASAFVIRRLWVRL
jgi:hypothetical protein